MSKRGNGEGSIFRRKDGRWCAAISVLNAGRSRRVSYYGKTRREVSEKLATALQARQRGVLLLPDRQALEEYMSAWLEHARETSLRRTTYATHRTYLLTYILPALGSVRLQQLTTQDVQRFVDNLRARGLAPATVRRCYAVLHRALKQACRWDLVRRNVAENVDLPSPRSHAIVARALTPEQALQLLATVEGDRMEAYYAVAIALGLRRGEALGLKWADVDFQRGRLHVRRALCRLEGKLIEVPVKSDASHRVIAIPAALLETLRKHRDHQCEEAWAAGPRWRQSGYVFTTLRGTPYEPGNVRRHLLRLLERAGLPRFRVHDLRHSAASLMYAQGVPVEVISRILGHADLRTTTSIYLHVFDKEHQDAAERMDGFLRRRHAQLTIDQQ